MKFSQKETLKKLENKKWDTIDDVIKHSAWVIVTTVSIIVLGIVIVARIY